MFHMSGPGLYRTRLGQAVTVRDNVEKWLDGLPYIVLNTRREPSYTVGVTGQLYPDDHPAFKDDQGSFQLNLFGWPRWRDEPSDIIAKVE